MIATDHAPHTPEEKRNDVIWNADCGFPGVETQMPLMLSEVAAGRMTLEHYVRISSANPARSFGLWPMKGRIAVGAHADIAVLDLTREETIQAAHLHSRGKSHRLKGAKPKVLRSIRSCAARSYSATELLWQAWRAMGNKSLTSNPCQLPRLRTQRQALRIF